MVEVTRRTFIQGSTAATAGAVFLGNRFLFDGFDAVEPTNKLLLSDALSEDFVNTTCWIGKQDCGIVARRVDGRVVKLQGLEANPKNKGTLCPKGEAQIVALYDSELGEGHSGRG